MEPLTSTIGTPLDDAQVLKEFKKILGTTEKAKAEAAAKVAQESTASMPSNAIATDIATMPASEAIN